MLRLTGDPVRDLIGMWQALRADGLDPELAFDVALLVQRNVARARFESDVLHDLESLPVLEVR